MKTFGILKNQIQTYSWGSHRAIADMLGQKAPSAHPQAELWMGSHPKAPSKVLYDNQLISLPKLIKMYPVAILGKAVVEKFGPKLPFLFKVLAAARPLSIQAHPNREQAKTGFQRETRQGIPLDAPHRNYVDDNHKPECICALTDFWALHGFRPVPEMTRWLKTACGRSLAGELEVLRRSPNPRGLAQVFRALMQLDNGRKQDVIGEALAVAQRLAGPDAVFDWVVKLHDAWPGDIGALSPLILNLVRLSPGQAMFLLAGEPHAYLSGVSIELMANSDNVLRGGLTPKHVDVQELMRVLTFNPRSTVIIPPRRGAAAAETIYPSEAQEFVLSVIRVDPQTPYSAAGRRSVEILLCTRGRATLSEPGSRKGIDLGKGTSVLVPAALAGYRLHGEATVYKAAVPV